MRPFVDLALYNNTRAAFAPTFSDYVEDVVMAADALVRVAIPPGATFCLFSFDADFRVKIGVVTTTLTLPSASSSDGSGSELSPAARAIPAKLPDGNTVPTHLCLRAPTACKGSISFYGN